MIYKYIKLLPITLFALIVSIQISYSQGRKLYTGATKSRHTSQIPLTRMIAYPWTWTFGVGTTSYFGQLCPTGDCFTSVNYQWNLGLKYRFTTRFSVGAGFRNLRMSASDENSEPETGRKNRNLSFRTDGFELQAYGYFDFIPIITKFLGEKADQYNRRNVFVPYALAGIGVLYFNPRGENSRGNYVSLAKLPTSMDKEQGNYYSQVTPIYTGGFGFRYKISEYFDIGADITYTKTFTDNLDDVAGQSRYPSWNQTGAAPSQDAWDMADKNLIYLASGNPADRQDPNGMTRGGSRKITDGYFIINFRVDYTMTSPFNFKNQISHKHFRSRKGTRHHHFETR